MLRVKDILGKIEHVEFIGNLNTEINNVIQLTAENTSNENIFWCSDKNSAQLNDCHFGTIICSENTKKIVQLKKTCNYIIVSKPRLAFLNIVKHFFQLPKDANVISPNAIIHPTVKIGNNVHVGAFSVIEKNCIIGDNTEIGNGNMIYQNTHIANDVKIGSNNTIGGVGFGYERNELGEYEILPHIGNVTIGNHVEIGNNSCIDRAVIGSTIISNNVKIDNLVHIAHGVLIGENSLIIANAMIGGSTIIGKNVWVAPSSSIINKIEIKDNSLIGMGAVVVKSVEENTVVAGNPAKFIKKIGV